MSQKITSLVLIKDILEEKFDKLFNVNNKQK